MQTSHRSRKSGTHGPRPRRGAAMLLVILASVVIAVLGVGGYFVSTQEFRGARNLLVEQRAFTVAEYGLNNEVSHWDSGRNLAPPAGMPIGAVDSTHRYVADGDTAFVKITRLTDNTFWVVSEGRTSMGFDMMESVRRTNAYVRIAYPTIEPKGAITTAGEVKITGAATVSGADTPPAGWLACDTPGPTVAALQVSPTVTPSYGAGNILTTPAFERDPAAADSNTYVRYGSETWNSLAAGAEIQIPGGSYNWDIEPVQSGGTCTPGLLNWGEPWRSPVAGVVPECQGRFPIIYVDGDLHLRGRARGQGILLINGSLELNGQFEFYGIIIARDNVDRGTGTAKVFGAIYARDAELADSFWAGTQDVTFSRCAIENALRGSAVLTRVNQRHWSQLY